MNETTYTRRSDKRAFVIWYEDNILYIMHRKTGGTRSIKCNHNKEFSIKHNKKTLSGIGGAEGIYKTIKDFVEADFATLYVDAVIDKLYPEYKEGEAA